MRKKLMLMMLAGVLSVGLLLSGGCANNAQTGAAIGGVGGATIGAATGGIGGAAVGGVIGGGAGYMIGNEMDK